jgi:DNA-binding transcriptional LysR family regulator
MIQLSRLEGFYWVATTGGYARAARAFPSPITQPGVHAQVKRLEAELGLRLFRRAGKETVVLTAEGEALYRFVKPFYEALPRVVASLKGQAFPGRLTIGASALALRHLLPPWMRRLQVKAPQIELSLLELHVADVELLRRGRCDMLVDYLARVPKDVEVQEVAECKTFLALPAHDELADREKVSLEQLDRRTFIAYGADLGLRELQLAALESHRVVPEKVAYADSSETILGLVAAGIGFSLVPWLADQGPRLAGVVARRFDVAGSTFRIVAASLKTPHPNPFVRLALECAPGC